MSTIGISPTPFKPLGDGDQSSRHQSHPNIYIHLPLPTRQSILTLCTERAPRSGINQLIHNMAEAVILPPNCRFRASRHHVAPCSRKGHQRSLLQVLGMECNGVGKRWVCLLGSVDEDQLPDRIRDTEGSKGLQEKGKEESGNSKGRLRPVIEDPPLPLNTVVFGTPLTHKTNRPTYVHFCDTQGHFISNESVHES